jgi:hypothetical protein
MQLEPVNNTHDSWFGFVVDVDGDVAVIGSPDDAEVGSVYIYRRINSTYWALEKKIVKEDSEYGVFGESLSVKGDLVAVGDRKNTSNGNNGAVFVYRFDEDNQWNQDYDLISNQDCSLDFGFNLALTDQGELLIVCREDRNSAGAVYYYSNNATSSTNDQYEFQQKLIPDGVGVVSNFLKDSAQISVDGNNMLIGTYLESVDKAENNVGKVHAFIKEDNLWREVVKLTSPPDYSYFGDFFALSGRTAVVSSATNVHSFYLEDCN